MSTSLALLICAAYVALLFGIAFVSDRRARLAGVRGRIPAWVFTLSISVYCTSWTFYGSVGLASRSGLEFTAIYLGPTLVFLSWWFLLRKMVRITKQQRLTSVADFISSRFGKSARVALVATIIALVASTPYLALQLKAVAQSFDLIAKRTPQSGVIWADTAFWVAAAMALFAVLFGARSGRADEHYPGVISAIALEAVVKLLALMGVGLFVVVQLRGVDWQALVSPEDLERVTALPAAGGPRWVALLFLSAVAVVCLPRQFQVTMVEAVDEGHFRTAAWLFPLYLFLISAFVVPIAIAGFVFLDAGANPDQFVLTVPLIFGNQGLATLAFIGGFSSATSMVIVTSIALSIMTSNHMLVPLLLRIFGPEGRGELGRRLLVVRQGAIVFVLLIAFIYYRTAGQSDALAAMGLIAFVGVAQFFPAMMAALFWRSAAEQAAFWALIVGFVVWAYTLLLPTIFEGSAWVTDGLWGVNLFRPQALLGAEGFDPVVHSALWSLGLNALTLGLVSLYALRSPLEQLQERLFVDAFARSSQSESLVWQRSAAIDDLQVLAREVLGHAAAGRLFAPYEVTGRDRRAAANLIWRVEQELAASIGAATARRLVSRVSQGEQLSVDDMVAILDQTQQALDQARQLEEKSKSLRQALVQLRRLDRFKDDFLSQVSHELRTPMTSLKAFADILREDGSAGGLEPGQRQHYLDIVAEEAGRLTGLLDELLDVQKSTTAAPQGMVRPFAITSALDAATQTFAVQIDQGDLEIETPGDLAGLQVLGSEARLTQVFINLISNAQKYGGRKPLKIRITGTNPGGQARLIFADTGQGLDPSVVDQLFIKFKRGQGEKAPGSGLGLAICRQILLSMGGSIELNLAAAPQGFQGACFELRIPLIDG